MDEERFAYLKWGTLARNFFKSAKIQAELINKSGNPWCVITDATKKAPPTSAEYDQITEASDRNIGIPVIYTFYHGLELFLKALIANKGRTIPKSHDLISLLNLVDSLYPEERDLVSVFRGHIDLSQMVQSNPIKRFCLENSIDPSKFYQALRYPESFKGVDYTHFALKYNQVDGVEYYSDMIRTIEFILAESAKFLAE